MRNKKAVRIIKNICIKLLIGVPLFVTAQVRYDCHYDPGSLQFEKKNGWDFIQLKGLGLTEKLGKPILPVDYIHLLIPQGQEAESINVTINSSSTIEGNYRIKPFLPENDSSAIDFNFYNSKEPYPGVRAEIIKTGSFAGNRIVDIKIYPIDYYPDRGEIVLFNDLTIEISCRPSIKGSVKKLYISPYTAHIVKRALKSIVDNDYDIPAYSYKAYPKDYTPQGKSIFTYPTYLIITTDSLMDAFEPLIHWITKKGIKADAISVDSILKIQDYIPFYEIYDDAGIIRSFLRDAYENGTEWVLLGGDEDIIPVRYGTSENNDSTVPREQPPSDLYYSSLDGNWDVDGDELYGEPLDDSVDIYPELFVGRLPCNRTEEIINWIEKVLSYEKNPGNGNFNYLTRVFWTAADEMRNYPEYIIENGSYPSYFEHDTTMLEDSAYTGGYFPKGSDVVDRMNLKFGWFNHHNHGSPDQLTVSARHYNEAGPDRDFLVSVDSCEAWHYDVHGGCNVEPGNGFDSLKNKDYYGIMYLASCYQGAYDQEHFNEIFLFNIYSGPSMAEAFTLLPERGGPAFLGYTRYAKDVSAVVLHMNFLETLFDDSLRNLGVTETISKIKVFPHHIHLSHTLFGCPLMPVWTNLPSHLNVTFADSILPDSIDFEVIVTSSSTPVKDAYVCLWKGDEVYRTGFSGGDGTLILPIKPKTEGEMFITVTVENFIPFEDTVIVSYNASAVEDFIKSPPLCKTKSILSVGEVLFEFYIPETDRVKIDIFDLTGRRVKRLLDRKMSAGTHQVSWNEIISNEKYYINGIYFYQFNYKNQIIKGKFLLIR